MGGAKRHLDNMVEKLSRQAPQHNFFILVNDRYEHDWNAENVRVITYPIALSNGLKRLWFDNVQIHRIVEKKKIDLLVSFANFGPYKARCRHILFETNALYFCDNIRHLYSRKARLVSDMRKLLIKLSGTHADLIVTPSESFKNQLERSLGFPPARMEVLYHAMDRESLGETKKSESDEEDEKVRFVCTSHLTRHKRVEVLLEAVKLLKEDPEIPKAFHVKCTFDRRDNRGYYDELTNTIEQEKLGELVEFTGRVDQNEMARLYTEADCMVHTTACESFGFALLEAKIFRLPTICSDIPVNKEIAKNAALYFKTDDPRDLARQMKRFILERPDDFDYEDELIAWNWERYAEKFLNIIERTAHG